MLRKCVKVGSIFDANQQNKIGSVNLFHYRDVITNAKQKTWAPCVDFKNIHAKATYRRDFMKSTSAQKIRLAEIESQSTAASSGNLN